jgi:hypothetical protein
MSARQKKVNWGEVGAGAAIIGFSILNIIPGDEIIAWPLGAALILEGLGWLK